MPYKNPEEHRQGRTEYGKKWYRVNKGRVLSNIKLKRISDLDYKRNKASYDRIYRLERKFGMELSDHQALWIKQNGQCAICKGLFGGNMRNTHIDHNHSTNKVRGLLCFLCNSLLGNCRDNTVVLQYAINYLGETK